MPPGGFTASAIEFQAGEIAMRALLAVVPLSACVPLPEWGAADADAIWGASYRQCLAKAGVTS